jgi:hypothetical protein
MERKRWDQKWQLRYRMSGVGRTRIGSRIVQCLESIGPEPASEMTNVCGETRVETSGLWFHPISYRIQSFRPCGLAMDDRTRAPCFYVSGFQRRHVEGTPSNLTMCCFS